MDAALRHLPGASFDTGECIVPGHLKGCRGRVAPSDSGCFRWQCAAGPNERLSTMSLAELAASLAAGREHRLDSHHGLEHLLWSKRLELLTGTLSVPLVELPALPAAARPALHIARETLALFFTLRAATRVGLGPGCMCSRTFLSRFAWNIGALSEDQAHDALGVLLDAGVIHRPRKQGRAWLYLPGPDPAATASEPHLPPQRASGHDGPVAGVVRRLPEREVRPGIVTIAGRRPHMPDDDAPDWWQSPARGSSVAASEAAA